MDKTLMGKEIMIKITRYRMNAALNAFSKEHDPQAIVWTWSSPLGAT